MRKIQFTHIWLLTHVVAVVNWCGDARWRGVVGRRFGVERGWDMCSRTTKKPESYADAVVIFCVLSGGGLEEPHILLVKQFRPPIEAYTIEMPAGLIDPGETPETVRERKRYPKPFTTYADCTHAICIVL